MSEPVFVAITMDSDEPLRIMQFVTRGRGSALPRGAAWDPEKPGWWTREATPDNIISEVSRAFPPVIGGVLQPQPTTFRVLQPDQVFELHQTIGDRTFRDALVDDGKTVAHDMAKAREIHRGRMRAARLPMLVELDVDEMRATEDGQPVDEIRAAKRALRDVTDDPAIEAAKSPAELKAVWPEILGERLS